MGAETWKTWTHWAVIADGIAMQYDDEEDAKAHLEDHPGGYVARCEVMQTPWKRVTGR